MEINLPNNWVPRPYQMPVFDYFRAGGKRAFLLWHRRSGKDDLALHLTACQAMQRVGTYWHLLPEQAQARKAIWEAVNPRTGMRRIDESFPDSICETKRSQDMFIRFKNGSSWSCLGSDNFNSLVGSPPVGLVFSEYALADPRSWAYLRPIIADNNGFCLMITTPRAKNHAYTQFNLAVESEDWFTSVVKADTSGVFTPEALAQEKAELISEYGHDEGIAIYNQEYMCDFEGAVGGAYFGSLLSTAQEEGRITFAPYNPNIMVSTGWDIGVGDAMSIVFVQQVGMETRLIDYYEASGESVQTAAKVLKEKPYVYEQHVMPHDLAVREWGGEAKTRYQTALELGIKPITLVKRTPKAVDDRIHAIRTALPSMYMDSKKCKVLIEHLKNYKKKWNTVMKMWENHPEHGPESHGVDALGTYLTGVRPVVKHKSVSQMLEGGNQNFRGVW